MPGAVSRWNAKKDLSWVPLRPDLVVEVKFAEYRGFVFINFDAEAIGLEFDDRAAHKVPAAAGA